ncbi:Thermostable monoacylglycerol lipase [Ascidiaceihabitans donghaensis]|uniref:Thermostable monoacylglycerol lipase n=1 Tax=Ascidiaceihabitans donghaensis TaxID=1510460 RepID=A0A2R8BFW2_9RHOB|nr:alpha/beta hydrolase [Ascidiaceihabitans donghaensis]SPH21949.1 Thermostable monoacylglycerol lipase [Ascidiaceihabitans donghaensis]
MKLIGRFFIRFVLTLVALGFAMWVFGPYEPVDYATDFDETQLEDGVDAYLATQEARFDDIRPDSEKRVVWAGSQRAKTDYVLVYLHGFSASSQEIRPVPDAVATNLGANLVYTRFQGHGRTADAMGEGTVNGWMRDTVEALAIARKIGDKIIVLTTSTGGTLAALAMTHPELQQQVAGVAFVAPNFGVNNPAAALLTMPGVRVWGPVVAGKTRSFTPLNDGQGREWTTTYPTVAAVPMAAAVQEAVGRDYKDVAIPALFFYAAEDQVVIASETDKIVENWGGPVTVERPVLGAGVDPMGHVIAGDIMSPAMTAAATTTLLNWIGGLQ